MVKYITVIAALSFRIVTAKFTKCCPVGKYLNIHTKKCVDGDINTSEDVRLNITIPGGETSEEDIPISIHVSNHTYNYPCIQSLRYNFEPFILRNNSSYLLFDYQTNRKFNTTDVCLDHAINTETSDIALVAQTCLSCSKEYPCINYCCPGGQVSKEGKCVENQFLTYNITERKHKKLNLRLQCSVAVVYPRKLWQLNSNGEMNVDGKVHDASEYCVQEEDDGDLSLLLCPQTDDKVDYMKLVRMVFMCLSLGSFILLIFLHIIIEDLRTNRLTKLKIPLYLCLLISFLITVITKLNDFTLVSSSICVILALLLQYFSLAIFFWLTSMSFDIWLGFRIIANPFRDPEIAGSEQMPRMKLLYGFSMGCPFVITFVTGVLQFVEEPEYSPYIHPSIGVACMIDQYLPRFLYWNLIIFILLCVNCVFYCLVVFKQCRSGTNQLRNFRILVELIFLMGINWFSEVISFFIGWQYPTYWDHPLLTLINSVNWIIGVILLLAFCCKVSNRNHIRKYFLGEEKDNDTGRTFDTQLSNQSSKELIKE